MTSTRLMQARLQSLGRRAAPKAGRLGVRSAGFVASIILSSVFARTAAQAAQPEPTLEALRAADRARSTDATEAQAWAEEKARLQLLLTAIEERTTRARARRQNAEQQVRAALDTRPETPVDALENGAIRIAQQLDEALDTLARSVPPGLIAPRGPQRADPREALDQALHRLERAERDVETIAVSIAPGRLEGEPKSVEVIRLGGVAAWWRSLDGAAGGEAEMVDGQLVLHPATDPAVLSAIGRASAIAKGRRAPEILLLPVRHARTSLGGRR